MPETRHGKSILVLSPFGHSDQTAVIAFNFDADDSAYEEPKVVKWLRARKKSKPYQPNLSLHIVDGGLQENAIQKAA